MTKRHLAGPPVPRDILSSYSDPDRVCPMLAGPAVIDGSVLVVRLVRRDIEVKAPEIFLRSVVELCDGTRTVNGVVDAMAPPRKRPEFRRFVLKLLSAGALIDSSLSTAIALQYGVNGNAFGQSVPREIWTQTPRRWRALRSVARSAAVVTQTRSSLDPLLNSRITTSTYGDGSITTKALLKWLWTIGGILREQHENDITGIGRRTIPSGGAIHAVRPVLILLKAVGKYRAGIYNVVYPAAGRVLISYVGEDLHLLARAVGKPSYLLHATGMVVLVGDPRLAAIKYRARATQYLLIEAGAAVQNAGLCAPSLGIATCVFGSYYEDVVASICQLKDELVLCSVIFGSPPSNKQLKRHRQCRDLEFSWAEAPSPVYSLPYFLARTTAIEEPQRTQFTWGRDTDPWMAYRKATAEAIERKGFFTAKEWTSGTSADFAESIDPRSVVRYLPFQYKRREFPCKPFDPRRVHAWVPAKRVFTGAKHWLLADLVYAQSALRTAKAPLAQYSQANSSGCAAGVTWQSAVEAAVYELVERDAFMRMWFAQTPGVEVSQRSLPGSYRKRFKALEAIGCTVKLQCLHSPWAAVMHASAQNLKLGFTSVGTGARDDPLQAAESALAELETYVYIRIHREPSEPITPEKVRLPEHHALLYANRSYFKRADSVLRSTGTASLSSFQHRYPCKSIVERLESGGVPVYATDITPQCASLDQGRTSLFAARAVAPGLVPVSFGYGLEPLGLVTRFSKQALFPHPLP